MRSFRQLSVRRLFPEWATGLADRLVHANDLIATENAKSRSAAQELLAEFSATARDAVRGKQLLIVCGAVIEPREVAMRARLHDLTIVPVAPDLEYEVVAEGLAFDSGRPVLLLPPTGASGKVMERVLIGWDGSRSATRALAESMPFCQAAKSVEVAVVTGEKRLDADGVSDDLLRHLGLHDIKAEFTKVPAHGRDAGPALMDHGVETGAGLLVIGAYGHSRTREFMLGGATRTVLGEPRLPILMAH